VPSYLLSRWKFYTWLWIVTPLMPSGQLWKQLLPLPQISELYSSMAHSRIYDKMMILPAFTCRRQRPCLMNLLPLADQSPWHNSTCMYFKGYAVSLRILSPACPLSMLPSPTLISIAAFLHMSFFTKPLSSHL